MTTWQALESLLAELPGAQAALADTVRALVYKSAPALFDVLPFEDDRTFLEPGLFAYFTAPDPAATLEQLLFAYVPPGRRPARLRAYADEQGAIDIPQLGTVVGPAVGGFCDLEWNDEAGQFATAGTRDPLPLSPPELVPGSPITVSDTFDPLLRRFVAEEWADPACARRSLSVRRYTAALERALAMMRRVTPALSAAIEAVTRRIVLYGADLPNSFATLSAHGVAFLNVPDGADEVFFLDDLAHQCGHIIFNALTQEKDRFLARPAETPIREFCRNREDPRSLYSAFHGLFTFSTILWALQASIAGEPLSYRQRHEAQGRIAFSLRRFAIDLENLDRPGLFTADGQALYELFARVHETVSRACRGLVEDLDVSDQPYVFDYARFALRNPCHRGARTAGAAAWSRR